MGSEQSVDIKVDSDAHKRKIDPTEIANLDVYVSTLSSAVASGLVVVKEFGLVSGTCARVKGQGGLNAQEAADVQKWAIRNTHESESAKSMAIAKLRTKAKQAGANAVLGLQVDMESNEWRFGKEGRGLHSMTLATATGTACILADMNGVGQTMQVRPPGGGAPDAPPPKAPPASGQFGGALGGAVVEIALPTGALGIKMNSVVGARHAVISSVAPGSPCERLLGLGDQITALGGVLGDVDCAGMTPSAITSALVAHKDTPGRLMHVIRAPATVVLASAGNCLYVDS